MSGSKSQEFFEITGHNQTLPDITKHNRTLPSPHSLNYKENYKTENNVFTKIVTVDIWAIIELN